MVDAAPLLDARGPAAASTPNPLHNGNGTAAPSRNGTPDSDDAAAPTSGTASVASCSVSLINTMIGTGVLGLPSAFASCGAVLGIFMLVGCAAANAFGVHLLACLGREVSWPADINKVAVNAGAPRAGPAFEVAIVLLATGACTSYMMIFGELMAEICDSSGAAKVLTDRLTWLTVMLTLVTPLAFAKSLDALRFTSGLAIAFVGYVAVLLVVYALPAGAGGPDPCHDWDDAADGACPGPRQDFIVDTNTLCGLCVFIFGYGCTPNTFDTHNNELVNPTAARANRVTLGSFSLTTAVYLVVSVSGYAAYGSQVAADVLATFPGNAPQVTVGRVCVSGLVVVSYPMLAQPSIHACRALLARAYGGAGKSPLGAAERTVVTSLFVGLSYFLAAVANDLDLVFGLAGAVAATTLCFIIPGYLYAKTFPKPHLKKYLALGLAAMGVVIMPTAVWALFVPAP